MLRLDRLLDLHRQNPADEFVLFALAKEHESLEDDASAIAFYERLRDQNPDYIGLYYHLGKALERLERPRSAIEAYRTGIETAQKLDDRHAESELRGALMNLEIEEL